MSQKILSFMLVMSVLFLTACGNNAATETPTETTKQEFILQTKALKNFGATFSREYTTTIQASSTLEIPSESAGKVSAIHFKEGQSVQAGATIISLQDSLTNYDLALKQAENNILLQDTSSETTLVNLDTQISNAQAQYDRALVAYNQLIGRNNLQYDNIVQSNKNQLKTYNDTYKNQLSALDTMMTQYLYDADKILGMTRENQYANTAWEMYLGALNGIGRSKAEDNWNKIYVLRGEIRKKIEDNTPFIEGNTTENIAFIEDAYTKMREFSASMIEMLQNNVHGGGLSTEMTNAWLAQWNGAQSAIQGAETGFISWKTQTNTFLDNYKNKELATKIAVESQNRAISAEELRQLQENSELNLEYQNADLTVKENIENAKLALNQAKDALENTKTLKATTEKQLAANKQNAELSLTQAQRNASKLAVKAPIAGTITKILAEVGQSVNNGTIMVQFAGSQAQATVEVDPRMALMLSVGQKIQTKVGEKNIEGTISAISTIPGANMLSTIRIAYPKGNDYIGQAATVTFEVDNLLTQNSYLLPVNAVTIIEEGTGKISIWKDENIVTENVRLGAMYGKTIEVLTDIDPESIVILNDTNNFDANKFSIKIEDFSANS